MIKFGKDNHKDDEKAMIEQVINLLKEHPQVRALFDKYGMPIANINDIQITFEKMDVSAKAKDGKIMLNSNLIEDGNLIEDLHYIIHELTHVLQQKSGKADDVRNNEIKNNHYLDNPLEIEAFKEQIAFINKYKSPKEAADYLKQLLDFHGYEGEQRKKKVQQLGA